MKPDLNRNKSSLKTSKDRNNTKQNSLNNTKSETDLTKHSENEVNLTHTT